MKDRHQDPPAGGTEERQALAAPNSGITDDRLLDYLYDELDEADRAAFELEMRADPALMREVEEHRRTRQSFARLMTDPMPAGLLDGVLEAADAQAATFATAKAPKAGWWQRLIEGLKGLAFQPAFAMGLIFLLVGGIALYSSRDPKDMPGMGPPSDVQRLPPVAMAPADDGKPAELERAENEEAQRGQAASANVRLEAEPATAFADQLARGDLHKAEASVGQPAPSPTRPDSAGLLDYRAPTGGYGLDNRVAAQPDPVTTSLEDGLAEAGGYKERETRPATSATTTLATGSPKADDGGPPSGQAATATGDLGQGSSEPRQQPEPPAVADVRRSPQVAEAPQASPAEPAARPASEGGSPKASPKTSGDDESAQYGFAKKTAEEDKAVEKVADNVDRAERARDSDSARPSPPSDTQETKAIATKTTNKGGIDELAKDVPSAPPMKTEEAAKPAKPAAPTTPAPPTPERLWSTLGQQMAAGALTDAQRTLSELVKVEGESARVKAARDELAKALAKTQPKPADTKPLPEPAKPTP